MILSLELEEDYTFGSSFLLFDLINKKIMYAENNCFLKEELLNIDINKFREKLNSYIIHWNNNYVNHMIIDGKTSVLKIYTENEIIEYNFKNDFPDDYFDFLQFIKKEAGIYE